MTRKLFVVVLLLLPAFALGAPKVTGKRVMPTYDGQYYTIYTDLPPAAVREAELRMTKMVETYSARTRDFSGAIRQKLPFYLFAREEDYLAAGGMEGTAGVFDPSSQVLMAVAGEKNTPDTWHVIQHEGFHQFAAAVIGGELPIWVNEGLAEYFGEGIFTGDGFVTGVVPDWRLKRLKEEIEQNKLKSVQKMMETGHAEWNNAMSIENYDQAWSMVQFLAHAEHGRYQKAFSSFMQDIARNQQWPKAWEDNFGSAAGFEAKWKKHWTGMPADATADLYAKAVVQTLTGMLGRAASQKQVFQSLDQLDEAMGHGTVKSDPRDWLPPSVAQTALFYREQLEKRGAKFSLRPAGPGHPPMVLCELKDGTKVTGKFTLRGSRIGTVTADIAPSSRSANGG
jgi:hypothetical protein